MTFKSKLNKAWTKALNFVSLTAQGSDTYSILGGAYSFGNNTKDYLVNAYGLNPFVNMVIGRIVRRMVQIDRKVVNRAGKEVEAPEFLEILNAPNDKENGDSLLIRAGSTYLATGQFFLVRKQELGEADQFFVPVNYNVTIHEDSMGDVLYYDVVHFGHSRKYLISDVLHVKDPDITRDTNHGFSKLQPLRKVWGSNNEVWASEAALHKNKGVAGILHSEGDRPIDHPERERLQNEYDSGSTGDSFGKVRVSTAKLGYIRMGMNPADLKSIEARDAHLRTICAAFNVDSKLFGDKDASTYNNVTEAQKAFMLNAVLPLGKTVLHPIAVFISRSMLAYYSLKLDTSGIEELQIINDQKSARLGRETMQGILRPNEARKMLYPELADVAETNDLAEPQERSNITISDIIQLRAQVTLEVISSETAVVILMQIYGLDEQVANELMK